MEAEILGDNYTVQEVLGEGSFGVVYLCQDRKLDRQVAVKVLKPEIADDKELKRFLSEARLLASLNHENVVRVYNLDESIPFIEMEYFPGRTLREIMTTAPLPLKHSLAIMIQVAHGLQSLHELQIVHRDLSPNNIMVDEKHRAKILDLGLARNLGMSTTATMSTMAGTPKYLAPEVIDGHGATCASDLFSFGVILYELVSGRHPFEAEHVMSIFYGIVGKPHPPLNDILPQAPSELSTLVDHCLEKDPLKRPTDLAEVAARLHSAAAVAGSADVGVTQSISILPAKEKRFRNPYLNRVMIKHAHDFYGRKQEVKRIYSRLDATPPGSVSVVGDRKIGKSSLLNYVYMKRNRELHLEGASSTIMVYLDLQQQDNMTLDSFVDSVLGIANLELRGRIEGHERSRDLKGIEEFVEQLDEAGFRLILLLDEFEAITTNPNFDLKFFSFLRYLANHYNVAYLTSSARDLQQLCHTQEIRDSPFFNIFAPLPLSVFSTDEAIELIRVPSARADRSLEPHEGKILEIAGLFPFFLQIACCHALEWLEENPGEELGFDEVRRRFYQDARLHYRFMWDAFDEHERSAILRVAEGRKIPDTLRHVYEELERKNYVDPGSGQPRLFSSCFHSFIETEVSVRRRRPLLSRLFGRGDG